ncbi:CaiB/BaiF CoA-transferase family protein [Acidocella sp. MX-AZ02]|uniref:CaiB/BaiF CoA transferase family protein n=1 Tax=Acidocella sp. MX-AZ02 TaxID=1214225 RepID=UPI00028DFBC7|nr:acyl-CoA transferase/carnitine dehydratase [Acidocella sp. MX-AZ02]
MGPLSGYKILDLSRVLAGPWASQIFADLGAEVIKIERPGKGDDTRAWGPPFVEESGISAYFCAANRGKKSVAIDISKPQGQALIRRLAEKADVVLENFKFGGLAKLGLGPEDLLTLNPRLVYCSITGFGQTGPYRNRAGYDFLMQGMGGLMSVTGAPEGEPMKAGVAVVDVFTGLYASNAVMAALLERERSGLGQHIDLALFDVQIAAMANQISSYLVSGAQPPRLGNAHPSIVPYQVFPTLDGHLILAIGNDEQFARFVTLAGAPELSQDERFATNPARVKHRAILVPLLEALLAARTTKDWTEALEAFGIPGGPINEFADIDADPQVQARGIFKTLGPGLRGVASPMRFSRSEVADDRPPPHLGADTDEVLASVLALSETERTALRDNKIIS